METNGRWFNSTRMRDLIAHGHAMPCGLEYTIGDLGICSLRAAPPIIFVNAGISVPISRGSPPICRDR